MTSKLKVYGAAIVAVVAANAFLASAAQAGSFDVGANPAVITGHSEPGAGQQHVLTLTRTDGTKFNAICPTASFEGISTGANPVSELTVTPTFGSAEAPPTGCTLFGQAAQVKVNGCKYTITGKYLEGEGEVSPAKTAKVDIVGCTSVTPYIQIKSALCELRIPAQNGLSHLVSANLVGGKEVTLEVEVTKITIHQVGVACPDGNGHKSLNGSLTGNTIMSAFKPSTVPEVTKHGHQYKENKTGEQVTLVAT